MKKLMEILAMMITRDQNGRKKLADFSLSKVWAKPLIGDVKCIKQRIGNKGRRMK